MSRQKDIRELIVRNERRLQKLKEKQASYGFDTPVHILTEIEDIGAEIEKLQVKLAELEEIENFTSGTTTIPASQAVPDNQRRLRLTVHRAVFQHNNLLCYFINVTNLSERELEITHVWFDCKPQVHALQPDRPLPKRLKPDETWETWIEAHRLPAWVHKDPYHLTRARLSTGAVVESQKNESVPDQGYVPGGPIGRT